MLLACVFPSTASAQSGGDVINREYPLKALFLYNFGSYVDWPASAFASDDHPFVIGILGSSPVESTLQEIAAARRINGRRILVKQFNSAQHIGPCQILFIARNVGRQEQQLAIDRLRNQHVLIVGETPGLARTGAVVNFFIETNKIRFEINLDAAREQELNISSKLLALARIVEASDSISR